ncbi:MAG: hypothetical protein IPI01_03350 [Ignavibacteriae bacterium]|nr:hypothetical protein [Ignavibacteriota bacterium]
MRRNRVLALDRFACCRSSSASSYRLSAIAIIARTVAASWSARGSPVFDARARCSSAFRRAAVRSFSCTAASISVNSRPSRVPILAGSGTAAPSSVRYASCKVARTWFALRTSAVRDFR